MTEMELRNKVVTTAAAFLGCRESDGSHKKIIDIYNSHTPRARGYKLKYSDSWCAGFGSAVAIQAGMTDIIPTEVSCQKQIQRFKDLGRFQEADSYVPQPGDYLFYDWQDNGKGDNTAWSDHVGIVEKVESNTIHLIEGNRSNCVCRCPVEVDGRYIRGFGIPDYASKADDKPATESVTKAPENVTSPAVSGTNGLKPDYAKSKDKSKAGTYVVNSNIGLKLRAGASTSKPIIETMPDGSKVRCYGYHTGEWLYVVSAAGNEGFCHSGYLVKA